MNKFYFLELWFHWYIDLCIVEWISKEEFNKCLEKRNKEWKEECENWWWIHVEWFYDWLAFMIEQLWWKLTCIDENNVIIDE